MSISTLFEQGTDGLFCSMCIILVLAISFQSSAQNLNTDMPKVTTDTLQVDCVSLSVD